MDGTGLVLSALGGVGVAVVGAVLVDGYRTRIRIGVIFERVKNLQDAHRATADAVGAQDVRITNHMLDPHAHGRRR